MSFSHKSALLVLGAVAGLFALLPWRLFNGPLKPVHIILEIHSLSESDPASSP